MDQISMVFQRVYLFQDTVYNNIAMGRTDATREEVYEDVYKRQADYTPVAFTMPGGFTSYKVVFPLTLKYLDSASRFCQSASVSPARCV